MQRREFNTNSFDSYGLITESPIALRTKNKVFQKPYIYKSADILAPVKTPKLKFNINPLRPYQLGILEIFGVGLNYNPYSGIGLPFGSGFLISPSLILTTNKNIPTSEHAQVAIIKFPVFSQNMTFRLSPNSFFFTSISKNFTIVALGNNSKPSIDTKLSPRSKFKLFKSANLRIMSPSLISGKVTSISHSTFYFTCSGNLIPGHPILNEDWKLQGMYLGSDNNIRIGLRIDSILDVILQSNLNNLHMDLEDIIGKHSSLPSLPILKTRLGDTKDLYWVQAGHWSVYHFDLDIKIWSLLHIGNTPTFNRVSNWKFKLNSRLIYLPDNSFLVIGGNDPDSGQPVTENLQVFPSLRTIQKRNSMQEARASCCLIYRLGYVYAIGGSSREFTCERYSIVNDRWEPFADLNKNRKNASATLFMQDCFIFVFGGEEQPRSIERYSFQFDKWEVLSVVLPFEFINPGIFVFDNNKIAVFGGQCCEKVIVVEEDTYIKETKDQVKEEIFRVFQVDVLPSKLVCCSSPLLVWNKGLLYFVNEKQNGVPDYLEFQIKKLRVLGLEPLGEYKNKSQSGKKIPNANRLLTPDYFDSYY